MEGEKNIVSAHLERKCMGACKVCHPPLHKLIITNLSLVLRSTASQDVKPHQKTSLTATHPILPPSPSPTPPAPTSPPQPAPAPLILKTKVESGSLFDIRTCAQQKLSNLILWIHRLFSISATSVLDISVGNEAFFFPLILNTFSVPRATRWKL